MKTRQCMCALLAVVALSMSAATKADPIYWKFETPAYWNDGGTLFGTFTTGDPLSYFWAGESRLRTNLLAWDVTTTAGTKLPGYDYDQSPGSHVVANYVWLSLENETNFTLAHQSTTGNTDFYLSLYFSKPLTADNLDNSLYVYNRQEPVFECGNCAPHRALDFGQPNPKVTGSLTPWDAPVTAPVPEPETYAMMLAGLGLLGVFAKRRKQKAVA